LAGLYRDMLMRLVANKYFLLNMYKNFSIKGVSITQKLVFARYLSILLRSGLTITEALGIIYDQASGRFKKIVKEIAATVQSGNSLSSALNKYPKVFSGLFVSAVFAGESSGTLENNLSNIAQQLETEKELRAKIKSAMVYPLIVLVATFFLGIAMVFLVLPKITPLFESMDMDLPLTTRLLIWISNQAEERGFIIFWGLLGFILLCIWIIKQNFFKPISHFFALHVPVVRNVSKNNNLANFCKTFGTLLKSGLTIDQAMEIVKKTTPNYYYQRCLFRISKRIGQGSKLSENLSDYEKYFPKLAISMISVGERSGNLEEALFYLADFYKTEVDNATKALSTAIEPILLIGIGLAVGGMALAIVTPIYQITGGMGR